MRVYLEMEMPNNCSECRFCSGTANTDCGTCAWCDVDGKTRDAYARQECPLIPVSSHGDLIDRKAAYNSLLSGMMMTGYQSRALDCIREIYVPTIIPASEEQEDGQ